MKATDRWLFFFAHELPCVQCQGTQGRRVTQIDTHSQDFSAWTLEDLKYGLDRIDVRCGECLSKPIRASTRWKSRRDGRMATKRDVAAVVELELRRVWQSKYDTHTYRGVTFKKSDLLQAVRNGICAYCGQYEHNLKFMDADTGGESETVRRQWSRMSFEDIIASLEETVATCQTCLLTGMATGWAPSWDFDSWWCLYEAVRAEQTTATPSLTDSEVMSLRRRIANGELSRDVARDFGCEPSYVRHVARGRFYAHLPLVTKTVESGPKRRLTNEQVALIKARLADGVRQKDVASEFGVSVPLVSHIKTGRRYADIPAATAASQVV